MKKVTFLAIAFFISFLFVSNSQVPNVPIPITVGPQPTYINGYYNFSQNDYRLVVTSLGVDANFNGVEDPGDQKPALYTISINEIMSGKFSGTVLRELDFGSLPFPTRIYVDINGNFAYVPNKLKIDKISLENGDIIYSLNPFANQTLPEDAFIQSVFVYSGLVFVTVQGTNINNFYIFEEQTSEIFFESAAELYPQQILVIGNYLLILCEGTFGQNDSKLMIYQISDLASKLIVYVNTIDIGDTGNHLYPVGTDKVIVTMNGSHQVHIINLATAEIEKTIQFPTTGFDGPRESAIVSQNYIVSTAYDGNLYIHNFEGVKTGQTFVGDKLEGLFAYTFPNPNMNFTIVAATSPFKPDYTPNDKVYLFVNFSDVKESLEALTAKLYPNPAKDFVQIYLNTDSSAPVEIQIVDQMGRNVEKFSFNIAGKEILLPINTISDGLYFAKVSSNGRIQSIPFVVIR
ncbi:T9SS C-terminal target domain-containing protein [Bacteroidetes/Chlorobi group bacterium Naka2016]|jgi:hypothetical protein|nr:MAG: T9SS C-terminal target domain-containing protein [Bacteroidetes/Chlorobi group bacterium Naka2016]